MSHWSDSAAELVRFIERMREHGASKVIVGTVCVEFADGVALEAAPQLTPDQAAEEAKKEAERLLYGSSQ